MKVLKFGGTSVGTPASLRNVKDIVESSDEQVIVVVSALGGITDQLINTAKLACKGEISYLQIYASIVERHLKVIDEIVAEDKRLDVKSIVNPLLEELGNVFRGINLIKDLSPRTLDVVESYGERLSSVIISNVIDGAKYFDSRNFIITKKQFGKHVLDTEATSKAIHATFDNADFNIAILPGFISSDRDGDITNLGRGGSDYTAAIMAATLDADVLEIWTDVDGFMTADPRVIDKAYVIDNLSFPEAMELCNFGAKVIYPPTIYPVFHKNIPIRVKNTFNPTAKGTLISSGHHCAEGKAIKGISSINDTSLITVC
ncbi:MAG: aspartate kinase, partial [Muribaculaceae bacterium]|nr:aspartate kinase [Muribaculaceae bacterium]